MVAVAAAVAAPSLASRCSRRMGDTFRDLFYVEEAFVDHLHRHANKN